MKSAKNWLVLLVASPLVCGLASCAELWDHLHDLPGDDPGGYPTDAPATPDARVADAPPAPDAPPPPDAPQATGGLSVAYTGSILPPEIAGHYDEAFDCARAEGGAWFGGVDFAHCFRKSDGSAWRVWNTGCGWEYGFVGVEEPFPSLMWQRFARTYSGLCAAMPASQLGIAALTTTVFFDGFGTPITGLTSTLQAP